MNFKDLGGSLQIDRSTLQVARPINHVWTRQDFMGSVKVRAGFGRNDYKVDPGLYAFGQPNSESDVLVTANYKLTFDIVRKNLLGLHVWLLVLDTKGVNVWCAAGKGTFGTDELINRIAVTKLTQIVNHRRIIVPQLGAVGIAAHCIKAGSGFNVIYGPVRAEDIRSFIKANYRATESMRTMFFPLKERIKLVPTEITQNYKYLLFGVVILTALSAVNGFGFNFTKCIYNIFPIILLISAAYLAGTLITPSFLPWLPFRSFSSKGALSGFFVWIIVALFGNFDDNVEALSWVLVFVSLSSFLAMKFTGASTFTSLSGVKKEMKYAFPLQIIMGIAGIGLFLISRLFN
jgi:hypothetical protein